MAALGQVQIDFNIVESNASPQFIKDILTDANWEIVNVSIRNSYSYAQVSIIANLYSSLDQSQIITWIRQDLGSRFTIGAVTVKILSKAKTTTPKTTTPTTTPVTTPTNNGELAAINTRLNDLIASLNGNKVGTPTTKKTLESYAAEFGVSKTALTLLVAAVGITVLLSLTKK